MTKVLSRNMQAQNKSILCLILLDKPEGVRKEDVINLLMWSGLTEKNAQEITTVGINIGLQSHNIEITHAGGEINYYRSVRRIPPEPITFDDSEMFRHYLNVFKLLADFSGLDIHDIAGFKELFFIYVNRNRLTPTMFTERQG